MMPFSAYRPAFFSSRRSPSMVTTTSAFLASNDGMLNPLGPLWQAIRAANTDFLALRLGHHTCGARADLPCLEEFPEHEDHDRIAREHHRGAEHTVAYRRRGGWLQPPAETCGGPGNQDTGQGHADDIAEEERDRERQSELVAEQWRPDVGPEQKDDRIEHQQHEHVHFPRRRPRPDRSRAVGEPVLEAVAYDP